tara:strand:+ start:2030 stop:2377 length:348 start_codon:yes stop_codon:yes gene_type:complete
MSNDSDIDDVLIDEEDDDELIDTSDSIIIEEKDHFNTSTHFTQPILTKYEKTMIIIERTEQILNGAIPLINNADTYTSVEHIVLEELNQKKIPFIIKRTIGSKFDYYKLSDLQII